MGIAKPASKEAILDISSKATLLGNKISVHMLEYISTAKHIPHGLDSLAGDFLDICRILWSIEAGINKFTQTNQKFPKDMLQELERKFRATYVDFQALDQMLSKFLEYERRGSMGRFQKGWRNMFADNGIDKMRASLAKSSESLKMSALVFQWTLGDTKVDESAGMGYTGLAAALDRLNRGRSVSGITKIKSLEQMSAEPPAPVEEPALPAFPALPAMSIPERHDSRKNLNFEEALKLSPNLNHRTSVSNHTVSSYDPSRAGLVAASERTFTPAQSSHRHVSLAAATITDSDTLVDEMSHFHLQGGPIKVTRIKADPVAMPHWRPRNTAGAHAVPMKAALINAVQESNHNLMEQLLDRGVSPDTGLDVHVLNEAVLHHDSETVRLLLLFGADPNAPNKESMTPLYLAVTASWTAGATMLLNYGADPNLAAGPDLESPLSLSIADNNFNLAHLLLTYGGDPNHVTASGSPMLIRAISKATISRLVDLMLGYGADPNGKSREGESPLFRSIQAGRVDIVSSLLEHGANPNLPGPKHMLWPSAYQPACLKVLLAHGADFKKAPGIMELATSINNIESVRIMLKSGVDPNAKKDGVYTPLCTSIRDNRADIFQLLLSSGADPNAPASEYPAWKCVTHFRPSFLPPLIQAGASLDKPRGILEMAVKVNNTESLLYLIDQGVNINDRNAEGHTPLTTAIRENRSEVVDLLLRRGASPNIRGEDWPVCMAVKQPALLKKLLPHLQDVRAFKGVMEMAVKANQLESLKMLLKAGVSVEDKNGGVFSPLTTALREDRKDITRFLLNEGGANPNAPGEHLPIVKAVRRYHNMDTDMIELLLEKGADPNKTYRGWNAIMQAVENGDVKVLKLLAEKGGGVDLEAKDDSNRNVWEIATSRGWDEAADILRQYEKK